MSHYLNHLKDRGHRLKSENFPSALAYQFPFAKIYLEHEYVARLDEKHDVFLKQWQSLSKIFVGM